MRDRRITQQQLRTLLLLALLPLATELLPGRMEQAGSAAWLCPLAAGGGAVVLALVCGKDTGAPKDLGLRLREHWGKAGSRVLMGAFSCGASYSSPPTPAGWGDGCPMPWGPRLCC